jgi:hypothetical protein
MGRRFNPRELHDVLFAQIVADGLAGPCAQLLNWIMVAQTRSAPGAAASHLLQDHDVPVPLGAAMADWNNRFLHRRLPDLFNPPPLGAAVIAAGVAPAFAAGIAPVTNAIAASTAANTAAIDTLRAEMETTRIDAAAATVAARREKTPAQFFGSHQVDRLVFLVGCPAAVDLPAAWRTIAAANGKRERMVVDTAIRTAASSVSLERQMPVITPLLAQKIAGLRFVGDDIDDLNEGLSPFSVVVTDHTSAGDQTLLEATKNAEVYDDLMGQGAAAGLEEIKELKNSKVLLPKTSTLARKMLQGFQVLLLALFGPGHVLTAAVVRFMAAYTAQEDFFAAKINEYDPRMGQARMLRYIQLRVRKWFLDTWTTAGSAAPVAVPAPNLNTALDEMEVGDMRWLPSLPKRYTQPVEAPKTASEKPAGAAPKPKATQVINPAVSDKFDAFRDKIAEVKFNDVIARIGEPPKVTRAGATLAMCASYHLRGRCTSTCARKADHATHNEAEDKKLLEWVKKAFE